MAIIYQHRRLDTNEVFYVGIGKNIERAFIKRRRSEYWNNIVSKTKYIVEILYENLSWEEACCKEIELIKQYGRKDLGEGTLVNLTDGGEGLNNVIINDDTRNKMSKVKKGNKYRLGSVTSEETKKKLSEAGKGHKNNLGKKHSDETKRKIRESMINNKNALGKPKIKKNLNLN